MIVDVTRLVEIIREDGPREYFEDAEEYGQHFDAVLNTIPKKKRYVFATFMLRLQQSIREGRAF